MKKSYLMIAAAAALFAACAENEAFKEVNNDNLISFSTYTQKATRAENSSASYSLNLKDHHSTFKVWGYKNTSATAVFDEEVVTYVSASSKWSYTNNRYWDKAATTYEFYAYAPSTTDVFTFNGVNNIATQGDGYFTIASAYTKAGENVSPKNSTTATQTWGSANTDIDLMIADKAEYTGNTLTNAIANNVTLNFIHILSRLNITLKTSNDFYPTVQTGDKIVVSNITIGHMKNSGTFNESSASGTTLSGGTHTRWTTTGDNDYSYNLNYDATQDANYIIEALIIPQTAGVETIDLDGTQVTGDTETKPYIKIAYSIYNNAKTAHEDFVAYYNLASLFGKTGEQALGFNEGWQNTLNITIAPGVINFDAMVAPWADNAPAGAVTVN